MQYSSCIKCGETEFELTGPIEVRGSGSHYKFVQCAACGIVVGTADEPPLTDQLNILTKKVNELERLIRQMSFR